MSHVKNTLRDTKVAGFTLIELLVVIAIIGILSSIVLASLSTARSKGKDAAVEEAMSGARAQGEIYAGSSTNAYAGVCTTSSTGGGLTQILAGAASSSGATSVAAHSGSGYTGTVASTVTCNDSSTWWWAAAPLSTGAYWCVDNNGDSKSEATTSSSATVCP